MKQFIILFFCATLMFAQATENGLFSSNDILESKIAFSPKVLRKSNNDTLYFDTPLMFKVGGEWKEMEIGIRNWINHNKLNDKLPKGKTVASSRAATRSNRPDAYNAPTGMNTNFPNNFNIGSVNISCAKLRIARNKNTRLPNAMTAPDPKIERVSVSPIPVNA